MRCPRCSREMAGESRYCSWCASPLAVTSAETAVLAEAEAPRSGSQSVSLLSSSTSVDEGRFLPGTVVAGRYRIAGLLGRGGMGEVYRATDLVLGQAVALKFLPEAMSRDDRALVRFYNEVRVARQVTHPNVCRVYDIGEINGLHYISMEFVDGEDLASLLRRIGRLPADKAVQTARQMCAGIAAAHEKGVLHRDLKPANVMIDGRGQVMIMDFGLAGLAEQLQADVRSGTPAYMSPEQLAGSEVTVRSDIYALGLVLYELFTGRRAFEASSIVELMQMQEGGAPAGITTVARDLDPAVERLVLRCLDPSPQRRPASALAVAAALPGGDPLAAAMAAGETPSPDLVAAAGETEGLPVRIALAALALTLSGIAGVAIWGAALGITGRVPFEDPPGALAREARAMLRSFGYTARPADRGFGYSYHGEYLNYLQTHPEAAARRWRAPATGNPSLIVFWYRESPRPIVAVRNFETELRFTDPPMETSGQVRLRTDPDGRLEWLEAVPDQVEDPPAAPPPAFDWTLLFRAARLDPSRFQPAEPKWAPLASWDSRAAWTGTDAATGDALRVEAAQWRGKPVFFRVTGPWTVPERMGADGNPRPQIGTQVLIYVGLIICGLVAWRNVRSGRADFHGAAKLALFYGGCMLAARFLQAHHSATLDEMNVFWKSIAVSMINAAAVWGFYIALEPWVRRKWPQAMIGWSRLTTMGIRDPLVGRDLLFGTVLACCGAAIILASAQLHRLTGHLLLPPLDGVSGLRMALGTGFEALTNSVFTPLFLFFLLFVARLVLRRSWLALAAFVIGMTLLSTGTGLEPAIDYSAGFLSSLLTAVVLIRFGLLAYMVVQAFAGFLLDFPRTMDGSQWYFGLGLAPLVLVALIALYGFRFSLAGRPLWKGDLT